MAWSPTSTYAYFDGEVPSTVYDIGFSGFAVDYFQLGFGPFSGFHMDGWLSEGMYLPRRMTNDELQEVTAP
jgi:hypothetical protein